MFLFIFFLYLFLLFLLGFLTILENQKKKKKTFKLLIYYIAFNSSIIIFLNHSENQFPNFARPILLIGIYYTIWTIIESYEMKIWRDEVIKELNGLNDEKIDRLKIIIYII